MFKSSLKDSEHNNLYANKVHSKLVHSIEPGFLALSKGDDVKEDQALLERVNKHKGDDLYKFKKSVSPTRQYELYLQIEKAQQQHKSEIAKRADSMEILAQKIRKGETLDLSDYKNWVNYNFLVFDDAEQEEIKRLNER